MALCAIMLSQNHFPEPNLGERWMIFFIQFYCAGGSHTESTAGDGGEVQENCSMQLWHPHQVGKDTNSLDIHVTFVVLIVCGEC
jgi:hypothetical protein